MKTNPNDPAFPIVLDTQVFSEGLTKLELFSAFALMGLVSNHGCHGYDLRNASLALEQGKAMIDVLNEEGIYPVSHQKLNEGKENETNKI